MIARIHLFDRGLDHGLIDAAARRQNRQPLHHVLELADVAGPAILFHAP